MLMKHAETQMSNIIIILNAESYLGKVGLKFSFRGRENWNLGPSTPKKRSPHCLYLNVESLSH